MPDSLHGRTDLLSTVNFLIDDRGGVVRVVLDESSGNAAFDSSAVRAAQDFRFVSARNGGEPVCVWLRLGLSLGS